MAHCGAVCGPLPAAAGLAFELQTVGIGRAPAPGLDMPRACGSGGRADGQRRQGHAESECAALPQNVHGTAHAQAATAATASSATAYSPGQVAR